MTDPNTVDVPWERCSRAGCTGVKATGGACLAHLGARQLNAALAPVSRGRSLDARGVRIGGPLLAKILDAAPKGDDGRPRLPRASFDGTTFEEGAAFEGVVFAKEASFDRARFHGDVSFEGSSFKGTARFAQAAFAGRATFAEADFGTQAWFGGATFSGPASFQRTRFGHLVWFGRATFEADAAFDAASFGGDATFDGARFASRAGFDSASFHGEARLVDADFAHEPRFAGTSFLGKGGAPRSAVRQAIWSGEGLATWPSRVAAYLIDAVVATLVALAPLPVGALLEVGLRYEHALLASVGVGQLAGLVFVVRNLAAQGRTGQSLGKRRVGISLVGVGDGAPIGAGRSILRQLAHVVDSLPLLAGWLWPLWDAKRQTLADKLFKTVVVKA
ncbi:MAG: pentapeptide repeat-containing protein [Acidimicrobiales bacterium]